MRKLLSLPPNVVGCFHELTGRSADEFFCSCDPVGHRLGSGGGSTYLLEQCWLSEGGGDFDGWLSSQRRILIHAGGQSRRLPAYAPQGKILTPLPVFRWERGQRLGQSLLDVQLPLYERLMEAAPPSMHTMIVSGDVFICAADSIGPIPEADVVCFGLWLDASIAKDHGVFVCDRRTPDRLRCMLQKPTVDELNELQGSAFYLTDIGLWMLSDRAVRVLMNQTGRGPEIGYYDLYADFGRALGSEPQVDREEVRALSVAVLPLPEGRFFHFGTSREMIASTLAIQHIVDDQREIIHLGRKPHPSIFTQNTRTDIRIGPENTNLWVENSHIARGWTLAHDHIITGIPLNDWTLVLEAGQCVDVIPIDEREWAVRVYDMDDRFEGVRQQMPLFPVVDDVERMGGVVARLLAGERADALGLRLLSAEEISERANLRRLFDQRKTFARANYGAIAANYEHSVFYQLDLDDTAHRFAEWGIRLPAPLPAGGVPLLTRMHDAMFRSEVLRLTVGGGADEERRAFDLLRRGLTERVWAEHGVRPRRSAYDDQIVWARSPVRIDIAGGWTDTPPYCLMEGGAVVNMAIELNGQPPLQTFVKPSREPHIVLRSIDMGAEEVVETYEQLADFRRVGSPFSIPKAALCLAGFQPRFSSEAYDSLRSQLMDFGSGIELTSLSAIPAGSGLGVSSILASTVLGALNDFCSLGWDKHEMGRRTLVLEQMLTTGGGWQDQFGGLLGGVKLLQTERGFEQSPLLRYLPDEVFTSPDLAPCHLLYYTGLTRTAKGILAEIVRRMFLNEGRQLLLLRQMKAHAMQMFEAIQRQDLTAVGRLLARSWKQNQAIDSGTNPPAVEAIIRLVDDYCLGYKLPGAGGGGYLYMIAKDADAAARIVKTLNDHQPNANARFVDMKLSRRGMQVSRS